MKTLPPLLGAIAAIVFSIAAFAEVQNKDVPASWQEAALADGEELYLDLCAVCHGKAGLGNGPAAPAMTKAVPDLTLLAENNEGIFPRKEVEESITGKSRVISHGTIDMPIWGQVFEDARPDWKAFRRKAAAKQRIYNLTEYLITIQAE